MNTGSRDVQSPQVLDIICCPQSRNMNNFLAHTPKAPAPAPAPAHRQGGHLGMGEGRASGAGRDAALHDAPGRHDC